MAFYSHDTASQLLKEATPPQHSLEKQRKVMNYLVRYLQANSPFRVSRIVEGGSLGMGTTTSSKADIDLVLMSTELPKTDHARWLNGKLQQLQLLIQRDSYQQPDVEHFPPISAHPTQKLPRCSSMFISRFALQFKCSGCQIDLLISYDWELDPSGYGGLYTLCCESQDEETRQWYSAASVKLQVEFVRSQTDEVKDVIKIMKHWSKTMVKWHNKQYKPKSYFLSLLVIKAAEDYKSRGAMFDSNRKAGIIGSFARLVRQEPLKIVWSKFYNPSHYTWSSIPKRFILDPANPVNNVAASGLTDWSQFIPEAAKFARSLGQSV